MKKKLLLAFSAYMHLENAYAQESTQVTIRAAAGKASDNLATDRKVYSQIQLKEMGVKILSQQALSYLPSLTLKNEQLYLLGSSYSNPVEIGIFDFNGTKTNLNLKDIVLSQIDRIEILANGNVESGGIGGVLKVVLKPVAKKNQLEYSSELNSSTVQGFENGLRYIHQVDDDFVSKIEFGGGKELGKKNYQLSDFQIHSADLQGKKISQSSNSNILVSQNNLSSYVRPEWIVRLGSNAKVSLGANFSHSEAKSEKLTNYDNLISEYYPFSQNSMSEWLDKKQLSSYVKFQTSIMSDGTLLINAFRSRQNISFMRNRVFSYPRQLSSTEQTNQSNRFLGDSFTGSLTLPFENHEFNFGYQYNNNTSKTNQDLKVLLNDLTNNGSITKFEESLGSISNVIYAQDRWSFSQNNSVYVGLRYETLKLSNESNALRSSTEMPSPILQYTHNFDENRNISITYSKKYATPVNSVYVRTIGKTVDNSIINSFVQKNTTYPELARSLGLNYSHQLNQDVNFDISWDHKEISNLPFYELGLEGGTWVSRIVGTTTASRDLFNAQLQFGIGGDGSDYSKTQINIAYIASPSRMNGLKHNFSHYSPTKYEVKLSMNYSAKTLPLSLGMNLGYQAFDWYSKSNSEYRKDTNQVLGNISMDYKISQNSNLSLMFSNFLQKFDQTTRQVNYQNESYVSLDRLHMTKIFSLAWNYKFI